MAFGKRWLSPCRRCEAITPPLSNFLGDSHSNASAQIDTRRAAEALKSQSIKNSSHSVRAAKQIIFQARTSEPLSQTVALLFRLDCGEYGNVIG